MGGNHALKLNAFNQLPPYFSVTYTYKEQLVLGRGEDTLLGMEIFDKGMKIINIDTRIFHDTFSDFPAKPSISNPEIKNRFAYLFKAKVIVLIDDDNSIYIIVEGKVKLV